MSTAWILFFAGLVCGSTVTGVAWLFSVYRRSSPERRKRLPTASADPAYQAPWRNAPSVRTSTPTSAAPAVAPSQPSSADAEISYGKWTLRGPAVLVGFVTLLLVVGGTVFFYFRNRSKDAALRPPKSGAQVEQSANTINNYTYIVGQISAGRPLEGQYYKASLDPTHTVVKGVEGITYDVDLRTGPGDQATSLLFTVGDYTKEWTEDFRRAMSEVQQTVIKPLTDGGTPYTIFLHGTADSAKTGFHRGLVGASSVQISYYPNDPDYLKQDPNYDSRFLPELKSKTVPHTYQNEDLPNLRAWFIQQKLGDLKIDSFILNGKVLPNGNETDRKVRLLLCIHLGKHSQ